MTAKQYNFENEEKATQYFRGLMKEYFELYPEQKLIHPDSEQEEPLRIDYLAKPIITSPVRTVGFEMKRGYKSISDFNEAVRQSINYRQSRVQETGEKIPYIFIFPGPLAEPEIVSSDNRMGMSEGIIRLAGKFKVGFVYEWEYYRGYEIMLQLCATPWWRESGEIREGFATREKIGSN